MSANRYEARLPAIWPKWIGLSILASLGLWYLIGDVAYAIARDRAGEPPLRTAVLLLHLAATAPIFLVAPLQFSRRVRLRWPKWHRTAGKVYLVAAIIGSAGALYLGITFDGMERRVPLLMFAGLWLAFSVAAWLTAVRHAFAAHERFVVRGYAIALAFVFVRVMGETDDWLFAFLEDKAVRDATQEWLAFVVPLIVVEGWYTWWPSVRQAMRANPRPAAVSKAVRHLVALAFSVLIGLSPGGHLLAQESFVPRMEFDCGAAQVVIDSSPKGFRSPEEAFARTGQQVQAQITVVRGGSRAVFQSWKDIDYIGGGCVAGATGKYFIVYRAICGGSGCRDANWGIIDPDTLLELLIPSGENTDRATRILGAGPPPVQRWVSLLAP